MKTIRLSPSKLSLFFESPQCFWDAYNEQGIKAPRPRGIFPSLPGGMDLVLKRFVDNYRGSMPTVLEGKIPGTLWDDPRMDKWRNWRTGPTYENTTHDVKVVGALDDMIKLDDGSYAPLDWKTKGSEPKDDGSQYYQNQLDCYALMCAANGLIMSDRAFLVYCYPEFVRDLKEDQNCSIDIAFGLKIYELQTSQERAIETIVKAAECLRGPRPDGNPNNEWFIYNECKKRIESQKVEV